MRLMRKVPRSALAALPLVAALLMPGAGCRNADGERQVKTSTELNSEAMDHAKMNVFSYFTDMADNAMLHDMSLADMHFVPHTTEISGTGVARLDRLAAVLEAYGGTVRYETYLDDSVVVEERIKHVNEYLAATGCNMSRVQVKAMMSGGRTALATEAIQAMERGTSKNPGQQAAAPTGQGMMAPAAP